MPILAMPLSPRVHPTSPYKKPSAFVMDMMPKISSISMEDNNEETAAKGNDEAGGDVKKEKENDDKGASKGKELMDRESKQDLHDAAAYNSHHNSHASLSMDDADITTTVITLDTFGMPASYPDQMVASPKLKLRAYQAQLQAMSPTKTSYQPVDPTALLEQYQAKGPRRQVDPNLLFPITAYRRPRCESDDELDFSEIEDPLDHDASANGFASFGQPLLSLEDDEDDTIDEDLVVREVPSVNVQA
jgi:hypothetical protein